METEDQCNLGSFCYPPLIEFEIALDKEQRK